MPWRILFCRDREIPTATVGASDLSECYTFPAGVHLAKGVIFRFRFLQHGDEEKRLWKEPMIRSVRKSRKHC